MPKPWSSRFSLGGRGWLVVEGLHMFDISKTQLHNLSDVELRELVARLCEAELRREEIPARSVRWSGAQTAPDGGLDVDCVVERDDFSGDFVPRPRTGFQIKKSKMPASKIRKEMSPKGRLHRLKHTTPQSPSNNGSSTGQTLSSSRGWALALGWMPSRCMRFSSRATPSRMKGTRAAPVPAATSGYISRNALV